MTKEITYSSMQKQFKRIILLLLIIQIQTGDGTGLRDFFFASIFRRSVLRELIIKYSSSPCNYIIRSNTIKLKNWKRTTLLVERTRCNLNSN